MATGGDRRLTDSDIASLAEIITPEDLETIALIYLHVDQVYIHDLKRDHQGDVQAFKRGILRKWMLTNPGPDQVKVLASILYKAAKDKGYVKVDKVQEILRLSPETPILTSSSHSGTVADADANMSEEVQELIQELKEYTEEVSKIPLVPWAEEYTVDMGKAYVKLSLEKIENKPTGPEFIEVENYAQLFIDTGKGGGKGKGMKVLGKGDPGMGKSTFGMKVAFDWAKDIFTAVSIIFFISLKLVRPGDSIENIIIQQTPPVEALEITEQKLKHIFATFGNRVLIILDGLDEHDLGSNENIKKVIEGRKLLRCNILLTSRPHCTNKIERYFPTVVRIDGFTKECAESFVSKHFEDKDKIEAVLRLNTENLMSEDSSHSCPMLLLFICVLVNYDELPLTQKVVHVGEIYFRLVRCIYRKYCVRKDKKFESTQFADVLKKLGKFALKMLQPGESCAQPREVIEEIGEDCFEYGLLIGQKGFKLLSKETSGFFLTFIHRTIQEFLGAFFFIHSLGDREGVTYRGDSIFLENRVFLQFSLWLLIDECEKRFFPIENRKVAHKTLISHTVKHVDFCQLDLVEMAREFSSMDIDFAHSKKDDLVMKFIQEVLSSCRNTKELYLSPRCPSYLVLEPMCDLLPSLQVIGDRYVAERLQLHELNGDNNVFIVDITRRYEDVCNSVTSCEAVNKIPSLYLLAFYGEHTDLSEFMNSSVEMFCVVGRANFTNLKISGQNDLQLCPLLTELSLLEMNIDDSVLVTLSTAVRQGKLPKLSHLCFEGCGSSLKGKLSKLFQSIWPQLTHLNLDGCDLDVNDLGTVMDCMLSYENKKLPKLTSLVLHSRFPISRDKPLTNITGLTLHELSTESYQSIATRLNQGVFPNLTKLSISMWEHVDRHVKLITIKVLTLTDLTLNGLVRSRTHLYTTVKSAKCSNLLHKLDINHSSGISGTIFILLCHSFPSLNSLILSNCRLNSQDLCSLAQARAKGRLPELKHLDISQNSELHGQLNNLFSKHQWKQLLSLNTQQNTISDKDLETITHQVQTGSLSSLQELRISAHSADCLLSNIRVPWPSLQQLHVRCEPGLSNVVKILKPIAKAIERELLPNLRKLHVKSIEATISSMLSLFADPSDPQTTRLDSTLIFGHFISASTMDWIFFGFEEIDTDPVVDKFFDFAMNRLLASCQNCRPLIEAVNNPAIRSTLMSTVRSAGQRIDQCRRGSRPRDMESLFSIYCDEFLNNLSLILPEAQDSSVRICLSNMTTNLKTILPDFEANHASADRDVLRLKHRLRRRGVRVYMSQ